MTHDEAAAIHQRLDRLDQKLDKIVEAVTMQVAICAPTRAKLGALCETVYGNGQQGLLRKVERLETVREIRSKGFWVLVAGVATLVSGIIAALVTAAGAWWK